jgi:hypothetical protein
MILPKGGEFLLSGASDAIPTIMIGAASMNLGRHRMIEI